MVVGENRENELHRERETGNWVLFQKGKLDINELV